MSKRQKRKNRIIFFKKSLFKLAGIALLAVVLVVSQARLLIAFEAHIINVTAKIVNDVPSIDPPGGEFCNDGSLEVVLSATLAEADIIYTTDGSDPECYGNGTVYINPFSLTDSATVKARTCHYRDGELLQSAIVSETYDVSEDYCEYVSVCGNGIIDLDEECDDGNTDNNDGCLNTCQFPVCGDGYLWVDNEECDDGNIIDGDGCNSLCELEGTVSCMKINEVYYDPGVRQNNSGTESDPNDEWIELYNNCDYEINIKDWYMEDNNGHEDLNHNYPIASHQFVVIAANASTWTYWPNIPDNAFKIALGGTKMFSYGLSNDGDVVILYDNNGNQIDEVSWGSDTTGLNPSVPDVAEGHSISRKEKGVDNNIADDWMDTHSGSIPQGPNPGTNPHNPDGTLLLPLTTESASLDLTSGPTDPEPADEIINEPAVVEPAPTDEPVAEFEPLDEEPIIEPEPIPEPTAESEPISEPEPAPEPETAQDAQPDDSSQGGSDSGGDESLTQTPELDLEPDTWVIL